MRQETSIFIFPPTESCQSTEQISEKQVQVQVQAYTETVRDTRTLLSFPPFLLYLLRHLVRVMQRVLTLQEHALLLAAGQTARQPRAQGAAADPQTGQRHGSHV